MLNFSDFAKQQIATQSIPRLDTLEADAESMARNAIGKPMTIRLSKTSTVSGVISKCEPNEVRGKKNGVYSTWNVWMVCGRAQVEKGPYVMKILPR
jgi:hypothetical protein